MSHNFVVLDRNKIYSVGKDKKLKTVRIDVIKKKSGKVLYSFKVYKVIRRKNKATAYSENRTLKFVFDTVNSAKKFKENSKKDLI